MDSLEKLVDAFKKFPGIGPRQARRFAYHLLGEQAEDVQDLGNLILKLKAGIVSCPLCKRYFSPKHEKQTHCLICTDPNRNHAMLMILSQDTDISAIEQRKIYNGLYYVIGKNVELTSMDPASLPRLNELKNQILNKLPGRTLIKEIILATNANTEGEHTAEIIRRYLKENIQNRLEPELASIRVTALGRGLSTGTELEYSDSETLKSALENRRIV